MNDNKYIDTKVNLLYKVKQLEAENKRYKKELIQMAIDIQKNASDVYWISDTETVMDRICKILEIQYEDIMKLTDNNRIKLKGMIDNMFSMPDKKE